MMGNKDMFCCLMFALACLVFCVFFLVEILSVVNGLKKKFREWEQKVKMADMYEQLIAEYGKDIKKYDRFLKWNSMLDTSYRTNGMVCVFRYKNSHKIEFCRYNPEHNRLPLEVYDFPGFGTINERMFDAWLPCIGGVAPVGENTIPQFEADDDSSASYSEDGWIETPSHDSCPAG